MPEPTAPNAGTFVWVDLASHDPAASRAFYSTLFGWQVEVSPDPQYGGYGLARVGGQDVAGIGGQQAPGAPTAWSVYVGTDDLDALAKRVTDAGGSVMVPPFPVGDQGSMAVFVDPAGAVISSWRRLAMGGFQTEGPNTFGWPELSSRGIERAIPFYESVFGWTHRTSDMGGGLEYTEFQRAGVSVAGAMAMDPMVPAEVPSYWLAYFQVADVDASTQKASAAGATVLVPPQDMPGGRFSILTDPQGASFGLLRVAAPR